MGLMRAEMEARQILYFKFLEGGHAACGILVPQSGIKPAPSVLEAQSQPLDHQGSPYFDFFNHVKCVSPSVVLTFCDPMTGSPGLFCPWDSPGKNTGVGGHFFLQGILPTQGSHLGLVHCKQTLYHLSHQGSFVVVFF